MVSDVCRQTKLDEALLSSGRVSDALQALMEWLSKAESYLTEDQPTLGDLDTVSMLLEQHKVPAKKPRQSYRHAYLCRHCV